MGCSGDDAAGDEEHAESPVVVAGGTTGDAVCELNESIHGFGVAVGWPVGGSVRRERLVIGLGLGRRGRSRGSGRARTNADQPRRSTR